MSSSYLLAPLMATIDFRGWRLSSDEYGWALGRPRTRLTKEKELEIYLYKPTYYATLEGVLDGLIKRELRQADTTNAEDLMKLLREIKQEIASLLGAPA